MQQRRPFRVASAIIGNFFFGEWMQGTRRFTNRSNLVVVRIWEARVTQQTPPKMKFSLLSPPRGMLSGASPERRLVQADSQRSPL